MVITLNKNFESYVKSKVSTGNYNSNTNVVQEALQLLQEQDKHKAALRNEIQKGINSIQAGRFSTKTMSELFDESLAKYKGLQ